MSRRLKLSCNQASLTTIRWICFGFSFLKQNTTTRPSHTHKHTHARTHAHTKTKRSFLQRAWHGALFKVNLALSSAVASIAPSLPLSLCLLHVCILPLSPNKSVFIGVLHRCSLPPTSFRKLIPTPAPSNPRVGISSHLHFCFHSLTNQSPDGPDEQQK